jgi:hypothetical protein
LRIGLDCSVSGVSVQHVSHNSVNVFATILTILLVAATVRGLWL